MALEVQTALEKISLITQRFISTVKLALSHMPEIKNNPFQCLQCFLFIGNKDIRKMFMLDRDTLKNHEMPVKGGCAILILLPYESHHNES